MTLLDDVQKIKLQLFHCLQRRHRDAWKHYWSSFHLYMVAKLSLEEFHALAEELLGPDKDLHNKLVVSLLSTVSQEVGNEELQRSLKLSLALEMQDHNGEEERKETAVNGGYVRSTNEDPLLQFVKKKGTRYDSEQPRQEPLGCKRPYSSIVPANNNTEETAAKKLMHLDRDERLASDHPDHQSAQLLMGLGKLATTINPSSIAATPISTPSNSSRGFKPHASTASRRE
ncbi:unnamed protein product [Peronospora farinosa]|uniref:Uncharacterized protein n=1 Tax=Peronospora farinosa TaxID=134698 RepID=A0AAV0TAA1_9STRA|nr:unnamed protein product [Peronospora farinosa]CAI5718117.1 unnamed protein product [Peronospora farinosa]